MFDNLYPIIYEVLCACFGYQPSSARAQKTFFRAFQPDGTVPQPSRTQDVCYFDLIPEKAPDPKYTEIDRKNAANDTYARTVPVALKLYFYGPNAEDNAYRVRTMLFTDSVRSRFRQSGIIPIPEPEEPVSLPEIEGTMWRKRCDLTVSLRILQSFTVEGTGITVPPEIDMHSRQ